MEAQFRPANEQRFAELPEPPNDPRRLTEAIPDLYLSGLENYIAQLGDHIRSIQEEESKRMHDFGKKLERLKGRSLRKREQAEEEALQEYKRAISQLRSKRKKYRQMERDALDERRRYLESMYQQKQEQELLRRQLVKLKALPENPPKEPADARWDFSQLATVTLYLIVEILYMIAFALAVEYPDFNLANQPLILGPALTSTQASTFYSNPIASYLLPTDHLYTYLSHILIFVFFGMAFLGVWMRRYGFTSAGYTFMTASFVVQWTILVFGFWLNVRDNSGGTWQKIKLTIFSMIQAVYGAATVAVTFGVVMGMVSPLELLLISLVEIFLFGLNYYIIVLVLDVVDPGGDMFIHIFGTMFGLGLSYWVAKPFIENHSFESDDLSSSYTNDLLALMGTLFVWVSFPSFNAALAPNGSQYRAILNTILSMTSGVIFAFLVSRTLRRKYFDIRDIQNATLAGGVAMASALSISIEPGGALLVGAVAGTISVIGFVWFTPLLGRSIGVYDTRGVLNVSGFPALIGAVGGIVAVAIADTQYIFGQPAVDLFPRGIPDQAGFQTAGLFISAGIGLGGGVIVGIVLFLLRRLGKRDVPKGFSDESEWTVPTDFPRNIGEL